MNAERVYSAVQAIVRTSVLGRWDGEFYYGPRNDDGYEVTCRRGDLYGRSVMTDQEIMANAYDANRLIMLVSDACRYAWQLAGGGALNIPFRIGTRAPKRLQIVREQPT